MKYDFDKVDALKQRLEYPVFGYTMEPDDFLLQGEPSFVNSA